MVSIKRNEKLDLKDAVLNRRIKRLVHFTSINNLENIFRYGLLPVQTLNERNIVYYYNDEDRNDNCSDAICLSIQRPNFNLYWRYKNKYPGVDWVVLGIKKRVIWEKDCAFCVENAASNSVRYIPPEIRKGLYPFNRMFEEYPGKTSRKELGISNSDTTHPQAEVLVFDRIDQSDIFGVAFENNYKMNKYKQLIPGGKLCEVQNWMYKPRKDQGVW